MDSHEEKEKILRERAEKLAAQRSEAQKISSRNIELIQFILGNEAYAVEACFVSEVYPLKDVTKLPRTPPFLYGIMNVRRHIVALIDLEAYFNLPASPSHKTAIILHHNSKEFAVVSGQVMGALKVNEEAIQPPLPAAATLPQDFIKGITSQGVVILNCEKLLTDKGLMVEEIN